MQNLITELLWRNTEVDEAADRLRKTLPGYEQVQGEYEALAEQIRAAVGYELYDRYFTHLSRYVNYDVLSYYALGLGLREELVQAMGL